MVNKQFIAEVSLRRDEVPSFRAYPFCLNAVRNLSTFRLHPSVTFLVGENGSGKSTLLEAIAICWGFNPEGGSKNFTFSTTSQSHSDLHRYLRLSKGVRRPQDGFFLRAESFFNVASEIERLDEQPGGPPIKSSYGGKSLHAQSHGESFLSLLNHRFRGQGLYILDEPEAALSPARQMAMLTRMHHLVRKQSQFIIATHSPIILSYPDSQIYQLGDDGLEPVGLEETEHFRMTRDFLNSPERYLKLLLDDEPDDVEHGSRRGRRSEDS